VIAHRPRRHRRRAAQAGFTLVELMVSLVMFSFAIAGVLAVAVSMANGFREQRLAIGAESTARAGMEFIADALRGVSPGVESGVIYHGDCSAPGAIKVTDSTTASDRISAVFAYGSVVTSSRTALDSTDNVVTVTDASQLAVGDTLLVTNFAVGHIVEISGVSGSDLTLASTNRCLLSYPTGGYPAGSMVIRALHAEFYVADQDGIPTLFMDPDSGGAAPAEPLAEGIEDLQVAIGIDSATDGISDVENAGAGLDEWWHNVAGEVMPVTGLIRAVRLTLVARSTGKLTGTASSSLPDVEDRVGSPPLDSYRRRVLTSIVEIRNLGGSP